MDTSRHELIPRLFLEARELDSAGRKALLDRACAADEALRKEVESLLKHESQVSGVLDEGAVQRGLAQVADDLGADPSRVGPYRILKRLGVGGMGVVFEAEQDRPVRRSVALKIIKFGMDTRAVVARFDAERQALAMMSHPNVARVFDAGATEEGRPYFVMELVKGASLAEHCDQQCLTVRERLELFMQVCEGVQHAHQKGIIHRDLKSSNVIVATEGARPVPKIIDFGVAKATEHRLTESTIYTEYGQLIGTPEYMSPEQAEMGNHDIDIRTDVYSLGVMLYELVVGHLPLDPRTSSQASLDAIRRSIREDDPPKPSTRLTTLGDHGAADARRRGTNLSGLRRELAGDLDWIVMRALEKDRKRRYASPAELAADIRRHLRHEPVQAGPPGAAYRAGKFIRRHRLAVIATGVVVLGLAIGVIGSTLGLVRARREARTSNRVAEFLGDLIGSVNPESLGRDVAAELEREVAATLRSRGGTEEEIARALDELRSSLRAVNTTDIGRRLVDGHFLDPAGKTILEEFGDEPLVTARLQGTLGRAYVTLGLHERAAEHALAALDARKRLLGPDHPDTLEAIYDMGRLLQSQHRWEEAEPYLREALDGYRQVSGRDHPLTLEALMALGESLRDREALDRAEPYLREALEICTRALGEDHIQTLRALDHMGGLRFRQGRLDEAESLLRKALEGRRAVLGPGHSDTQESLNNMGAVLWGQGRLDEAEPYFREAMNSSRERFGDDHPVTLTTIANLAYVLYVQSRLDEAEPYLREAFEGRRRVLGDDHAQTLDSIYNLGVLLSKQRKLTEAEPYHREALEGRRRILGDQHPYTIDSVNSLCRLLRLESRLEEAEPYCLETFEHQQRHLGDDHPDTQTTVRGLSALYEAWGKQEQAAEWAGRLADAGGENPQAER